MWFIIFPPRRQQNYWSMLSVPWSKGRVCGWVSMCPQLHCSQFGTGAIFDKSWWFSAAKQLATSYEKHPCLCSETRTHTHAHAPMPHSLTLIHAPGSGWLLCSVWKTTRSEWMRPQSKTDAICSQVSVTINAGETCRWDNSVQAQAKERWLDTFHLGEVRPIRGSMKRRTYGNQPSTCVSVLRH